MRSLLSIAITCLLMAMTSTPASAAPDTLCYEMRIYYAAPGKLDDLNSRFRNHTLKLFEKHGMKNVGYWMPIDNPESKLVYVLSYPSREAREASWKAFVSDPEWKAVAKSTEANGRLVAKVETRFMSAIDYSPAITPVKSETPGVFELRTYTATPGKLSNLNARFRNHTVELFQKHGMKNLAYWNLLPGEKGADDTLIYLLGHASKAAGEASFKSFREDPKWKAAREASEANAGGSLTVPNGVKSEYMVPTDYSPWK